MAKSFSGRKLWEHGAGTVPFCMDDIQVVRSLVVTEIFQDACEDDTVGDQTTCSV